MAPRQTCRPRPKLRCGLGVRVTSSRSGSAKTSGIAIRGPVQQHADLTGTNPRAPDLDRHVRNALADLDGSVVAKKLFDRVRNPGGLPPQELRLIRMSKQGQRAHRDEILRGSMPRLEKDVAAPDQFIVRQPMAGLVLRLDEGTHQVRSRVRAMRFDESREIVGVAPGRDLTAPNDVVRRLSDLAATTRVDCPVIETEVDRSSERRASHR